MNTENLKIKEYATAIKNLPDYPSDAGYTAQMLKDAFDARSDSEIKEKHNALVDAVNEEVLRLQDADGETERKAKEYVDGAISEHNKSDNSHVDIRESISNINAVVEETEKNAVKKSDINNDVSAELDTEQLSNPPSTRYARMLIEELEEELGVMPNDTGHSEKMVRRANTAFFADEADIADIADKDGNGKRISTTYATKEELSLAVGDISSALDELHTYAQALVNGGAE